MTSVHSFALPAACALSVATARLRRLSRFGTLSAHSSLWKRRGSDHIPRENSRAVIRKRSTALSSLNHTLGYISDPQTCGVHLGPSIGPRGRATPRRLASARTRRQTTACGRVPEVHSERERVSGCKTSLTRLWTISRARTNDVGASLGTALSETPLDRFQISETLAGPLERYSSFFQNEKKSMTVVGSQAPLRRTLREASRAPFRSLYLGRGVRSDVDLVSHPSNSLEHASYVAFQSNSTIRNPLEKYS